MDIPFGFCHCGCGNKTSIIDRHDTKLKAVKGQPRPYLKGHASRISPVDYVVEDRGYETPCWIWQRGTEKHGYGRMKHNGRQCSSHRVYYERVKGPVPKSEAPLWLVLDHLCRVPSCVNPDHLELVTQAVNRRRGVQKSLTAEIVREIRESPETQASLALRFGVAQSCISEARRGVSWKDV